MQGEASPWTLFLDARVEGTQLGFTLSPATTPSPLSHHPNEQQTYLESGQNPFAWHTLNTGARLASHPQPGYGEDLRPARYVPAWMGKPFPTNAEQEPPETEQTRALGMPQQAF